MVPAGGERKQAGQRVLVLWLCWLVLALFLVAAGFVVTR